MFDVSAVKQDFGAAASDYDAHAHLQRDVRAALLGMISGHWPQGSHILDLGCGTGVLAQESRNFGWQITGLDIAYGMCLAAHERQEVVTANAKELPFADNSFDGIFSSLMLQWSDTPEQVFSEIARVLKPGGTCVLSTLAEGTLDELGYAFRQVDSAAHVSGFLKTPDLYVMAGKTGLGMKFCEEQTHIQHYPDLMSLMKSLKIIGAGNKHQRRRRGLMTPRQLAQVETIYRQKYATKNGLPMRWNVVNMVLGA